VTARLVVALLGAALAGCGPSLPEASHPTAPSSGGSETAALGAAATDFTLRDVEGRNVRLSDYEGKVVLLDFWATWCVPCEAEIPHLEALYEQNRDKGFVVLGISMDGPETVATVAPFARRFNLTFPVLLDEETRVVGVYNPKRTAPLGILVDRTGRIAQVRQGYSAGDETLIAAEVAAALTGGKPAAK
jgi:peroxiredoxin